MEVLQNGDNCYSLPNEALPTAVPPPPAHPSHVVWPDAQNTLWDIKHKGEGRVGCQWAMPPPPMISRGVGMVQSGIFAFCRGRKGTTTSGAPSPIPLFNLTQSIYQEYLALRATSVDITYMPQSAPIGIYYSPGEDHPTPYIRDYFNDPRLKFSPL